MAFSIDLIDTDSQIRKKIIDEMIKHLNSKARLAIPNIVNELSVLIENELRKTLVYTETQVGVLNALLGFRKGKERKIMDGIIAIIAREVKVEFVPFRNKSNVNIEGGYTIYMIDSEFKKALNSSLAVTINKGEPLLWLEWLLKEGDKIIIKKYKVVVKPTSHGRSKEALMVKSNLGPGWRVPAQFTGVENLNWITKAFKGNSSTDDSVLNDIYIKMENIVYSNLNKVL
jgi:hypothetical protein